MTDPFNIVKDELKRSVNKTKSLLESYNVIIKNQSGSNGTNAKLLTEIRANLKSIGWDIQDLEETINIASASPAKFNLTDNDIENRRQFIQQTREFVQKTKKIYSIELDDSNLLASGTTTTTNKSNQNSNNINIKIPDVISNAGKSSKYFKLEDHDDSNDKLDIRKGNSHGNSSTNNYGNQLQMQQENIFKEQDKNLDLISNRVSNLKNISQTMTNELDDQAFLLDDMGREMDTADSKMGSVMKKLTKVLHMSSDKRQWTLIGVLVGAIVLIFLLLIIL